MRFSSSTVRTSRYKLACSSGTSMGMEELTGSVSGVLSGCACTNLGCISPALWLVLIECQLLTRCWQKPCRLRVGRIERSPGTTRLPDRIRTFDWLHRFFALPSSSIWCIKILHDALHSSIDRDHDFD